MNENSEYHTRKKPRNELSASRACSHSSGTKRVEARDAEGGSSRLTSAAALPHPINCFPPSEPDDDRR